MDLRFISASMAVLTWLFARLTSTFVAFLSAQVGALVSVSVGRRIDRLTFATGRKDDPIRMVSRHGFDVPAVLRDRGGCFSQRLLHGGDGRGVRGGDAGGGEDRALEASFAERVCGDLG